MIIFLNSDHTIDNDKEDPKSKWIKTARKVGKGSNSLSSGNSGWDLCHKSSLILYSAFRPTINIPYFSGQVSPGELHSTFSSRKTRFPRITNIKHFAAELSHAAEPQRHVH